MKRALMLAPPALAALLTVSTPASAQFAGGGDTEQMEQFAPVLEAIKQRMGKKRFGQLMQTVGPMVDPLLTGQGSGAAFGGQSFDAGRLAGLVDAETIAGLVRAFEPAERPARRQARRARR